jgi:alpha-galactosidase
VGTQFELKLAGFPAVEGKVRAMGGKIFLKMSVDDSKVTPRHHPWDGSCIELFFASLNGRSGIHQYFVVPQPGARKVKVLARDLKPASAIEAKIRPAPKGTGYEIEVAVPFSATGLQAGDKSVLFDAIVNLSALGDAHSGGKTSLGGGLDSSSSSARYAHVDLAGAN